MMRKLLIAVAVLAVPGMVLAQGIVTAPNVDIDVAGGPKTVDILITGPVAIPGINLNVQIADGAYPAYTGGPRIVAVDVSGPGTLLNVNNNGPVLMPITEQLYFAGTATVGQNVKVAVADGATVVLARVTLDATGSALGTYAFSLEGLNGPTDYADETGQLIPTLVNGSINVVPEPTTALLLLGALPLLRRRH